MVKFYEGTENAVLLGVQSSHVSLGLREPMGSQVREVTGGSRVAEVMREKLRGGVTGSKAV